MKRVTVHEAKTHLSRLIKEALEGEEVVIARGTVPLVKIVALSTAERGRKPGGAQDLIKYIAEDFDAPLDDLSEYTL